MGAGRNGSPLALGRTLIALNVKAAHQPADAISRGHQLTRNDRPWLLS